MKRRRSIPAKQTNNTLIVLGEQDINLVNHAGLVSWETIQPAIRLVVDWATITPTDNILLFGCHQGALPTYLAKRFPDNHLTIIDHHHTALETTRQTLHTNSIAEDFVSILGGPELPAEFERSFGTVILLIPKSRVLARLQERMRAIDGEAHEAGEQ